MCAASCAQHVPVALRRRTHARLPCGRRRSTAGRAYSVLVNQSIVSPCMLYVLGAMKLFSHDFSPFQSCSLTPQRAEILPIESRMRYGRPHRLTAFGTSPASAGEAMMAVSIPASAGEAILPFPYSHRRGGSYVAVLQSLPRDHGGGGPLAVVGAQFKRSAFRNPQVFREALINSALSSWRIFFALPSSTNPPHSFGYASGLSP